MFNAIRKVVCGIDVEERVAIINKFIASREPESDLDFFAACTLPDSQINRFIIRQTRSILARHSGFPAEFLHSTDRLDHDLREQAGLDSLDYVELIMSIEEALGIRLADSELELFPPIYLRSIPVIDYMQTVHKLVYPKMQHRLQ